MLCASDSGGRKLRQGIIRAATSHRAIALRKRGAALQIPTIFDLRIAYDTGFLYWLNKACLGRDSG